VTSGITDAHERLQPVADPSPHWSDSLYFNAWDPATDTFLIRIAVLANTGTVTAGMLVWRAGVPAYAFGRELGEIPPTDWDVMQVDGLTYRMLASGRSWAVQLDDGATQAHLEWHGVDDAVSYDHHPQGALPRAVAWGHYEQTCRVTGDLVLEGGRVHVDGVGQRDHSWGFRHWAGLHQWHWVTGYLPDGRGFNLFEVQGHDGDTTVNGYVQRADESVYVVAATQDLERAADGGAERGRLALRLADGTTVTVAVERAGGSVPVRPAGDQPVVVHETPISVVIDFGAGDQGPGFGIYEHLVTEFD
jgi:hypothetical protein